jgi:hypothetical protein
VTWKRSGRKSEKEANSAADDSLTTQQIAVGAGLVGIAAVAAFWWLKQRN